jgi:hypothetical protein
MFYTFGRFFHLMQFLLARINSSNKLDCAEIFLKIDACRYKKAKVNSVFFLLLSLYTIINTRQWKLKMEYQIRVENQKTICADEEKNKTYVWIQNGLLDYYVWSWDQPLLSYYLRLEPTWWRVFRKRVVRAKFDIYGFFFIKITIAVFSFWKEKVKENLRYHLSHWNINLHNESQRPDSDSVLWLRNMLF